MQKFQRNTLSSASEFSLALTVALWVAKQSGYCGWYGDGWPTGESWDCLHGRSTPLQPLYLFVQINTTNNKLGNVREAQYLAHLLGHVLCISICRTSCDQITQWFLRCEITA
jgi:hypothetical protein